MEGLRFNRRSTSGADEVEEDDVEEDVVAPTEPGLGGPPADVPNGDAAVIATLVAIG